MRAVGDRLSASDKETTSVSVPDTYRVINEPIEDDGSTSRVARPLEKKEERKTH